MADSSLLSAKTPRPSTSHCVRSTPAFRAAVRAVARELGVSESALFRAGVVALIGAHPGISDEHKQALAESNARIRSWVEAPFARSLSTTGEG